MEYGYDDTGELRALNAERLAAREAAEAEGAEGAGEAEGAADERPDGGRQDPA